MICTQDPVFDEAWEGVSPQGRDFVQKLLQRDPAKRLTADAAKTHEWIVSNKPVK